MRSASDVPGHSMYGDWALPGREYSYISLVDLVHALGTGLKPQTVSHADICAKPGNWFGGDDFQGPRFDAADPQYPGLLIRDMPNPCERPFRMVDGRRRLEKLRRAGVNQSPFYVFDFSAIEAFIFDFDITG